MRLHFCCLTLTCCVTLFDGHLTIDCIVRAERGANPDDGDEEKEVMLLMNMVIIWMMSRMMMMNIRMIMMTR